ncbi:hypothetical protein [uncultured Pontibacter sp.]|uniref:hypothetical protein n=1 Tax=uncultured Pontibacter sp. TaxID=453356 RepID=UPI00262FD1B7|nr:hypothetical protein [uncultured Pontibacter sp.]
MALIGLLLKLKAIGFVNKLNLLSSSVYLLAGLGIFVNSYILAVSIDSQASQTSLEPIVDIGMVSIYIITLLSAFFPSYTPMQRFVTLVYPVSHRTRFIANLLLDFISAITLVLFLLLFLTTLFSEYLDFYTGLRWLLALLSAYLLKRVLLILFGLKRKKGVFTTVVVLILSLAAGVALLLSSTVIINVACLFSLFAATFIFEEHLSSDQPVKASSRKVLVLSFSAALSVLVNNRKIMLPLLFGIIFKIFILFIYISKGHRLDGHEKAIMMPLFFVMASPVLIFNYVFNNAWGYFRDLWYAIEISNNSKATLALFYLKLLAFPILLDAAVSLAYFNFLEGKLLLHIAYYLTSFVTLIAIGLYSSLLFPIFLKKSFSMGANTNIPMSLLAMLTVASMYPIVAYLSAIWVYFFMALYILIAAFALISYPFLYISQKEALFKKLYY